MEQRALKSSSYTLNISSYSLVFQRNYHCWWNKQTILCSPSKHWLSPLISRRRKSQRFKALFRTLLKLISSLKHDVPTSAGTSGHSRSSLPTSVPREKELLTQNQLVPLLGPLSICSNNMCSTGIPNPCSVLNTSMATLSLVTGVILSSLRVDLAPQGKTHYVPLRDCFLVCWPSLIRLSNSNRWIPNQSCAQVQGCVSRAQCQPLRYSKVIVYWGPDTSHRTFSLSVYHPLNPNIFFLSWSQRMFKNAILLWQLQCL